MAIDKTGAEVSEDTWKRVDFVVKDFIRRWPVDWLHFQNDLKANRSQYNVATEGDLAKSSFRNTLAFPIIARRKSEEAMKNDPAQSEITFVESLKDELEKIIPGFTKPDDGLSKNKLYYSFINRYGVLFRPSEQENH